jgi:hypothetical protein
MGTSFKALVHKLDKLRGILADLAHGQMPSDEALLNRSTEISTAFELP